MRMNFFLEKKSKPHSPCSRLQTWDKQHPSPLIQPLLPAQSLAAATVSSQNCTNTKHSSRHQEILHFPCSGSFCCPLPQLCEILAAYKLQFEKDKGKVSLRLKTNKQKQQEEKEIAMQSNGENPQNPY